MRVSIEDSGLVRNLHRAVWPLRHSNMAPMQATYNTHNNAVCVQTSCFNKDLNGNALQISTFQSAQVVWQLIRQNQPSQIPTLSREISIRNWSWKFSQLFIYWSEVMKADDTLNLKWFGCTEYCSALRRRHVIDGSAGTPVSAVTEIKCKQVAAPHLIEASDSGSLEYLFICKRHNSSASR